MKTVVLCGGKGTRLNELTDKIPKPLIQIGDKPILWHIMNMYRHYGHNDFILCLGYKGEEIRSYFRNETKFKITFVDTGIDTNKAERIKMTKDLLDSDDFFVTYGDDLSDVDINKVLEFHKQSGKITTLTAVTPESPFGIIRLNSNNEVVEFKEKPILKDVINGGFYVFNKRIFSFLKEGYDLEKEAFAELSRKREICAYRHDGFWKSMNTLKDVIELNEMWDAKNIPWLK